MQQIGRKAMLSLLAKIGGTYLMQYLAEGILPQKHNERYKLERLAVCYFLHDRVLFKKGYDEDRYDVWVPKKWGR